MDSGQHHKVPLLDGKHLAPNLAGIVGPTEAADYDDNGDNSGLKHRHQHQGHQNGRQGEGNIHQPHYQPVDAAAEVAGGQAQHGANAAGDEDGKDGDHQGDAGAVDDTAVNVPAQAVGAEQVRRTAPFAPGRRDKGVGEAAKCRDLGGQEGAEQGADNYQGQDDARQPGQPAKSPPRQKRSASLYQACRYVSVSQGAPFLFPKSGSTPAWTIAGSTSEYRAI